MILWCNKSLVDIVLVRSDSIFDQPSIRDQKIINSLRKRYSTFVLGWNRQRLPKEKINNHMKDIKLFELRAPSGAPSLLVYLPFFWIWVLIKLCVIRPKIIHSCDLETILPCYIYKTIFRKKLVFDVFDRHAMAYIPRKNIFFKILYSVTNSFEDRLSKGADVLISVSNELIMTFQRRPKYCVPIMNCAEDQLSPTLPRTEGDAFTIAFTGHIRRHRGLETLTSAISDLKNVELIITGKTEDKELLTQIQGITNVRYLGFLEHSDVLKIEADSDVIFALYDLTSHTQNKYVIGNKLFEAMMCGVPIITNVADEIVNETECGIIVEYDNIEQIKKGITTLRDNPELCKRLGDNGRKAFLEKYNWNIMEQRLYKVYEDLL